MSRPDRLGSYRPRTRDWIEDHEDYLLGLAEPWFREGLRELLLYVREFGSAAVPFDYVAPSGFRLGYWRANRIKAQRQRTLSRAHANILAWLPAWPSDRRDARFLAGLEALRSFTLVHRRLPTRAERWGDKPVGRWAEIRRQEYARGALRSDRVDALDSIPGWQWPADRRDPVTLVARFAARTGTCAVPKGFVTEDGFHLGQWVARIRRDYACGRVDVELAARTSALPGWRWTTPSQDRTEAAEAGLRLLQPVLPSTLVSMIQDTDHWFRPGLLELLEWVQECGSATVPLAYRSRDGFALGFWCQNRRAAKSRGTLSPAHVRLLESLPGWHWQMRRVEAVRRGAASRITRPLAVVSKDALEE
jgi:hypothetical protein